MGCIRPSCLLLGLLLVAHHVVVGMAAKDDQKNSGNMELRDVTRSSRWLRGNRKMGGENHVVDDELEAVGVNKGPTNTGANPSVGKYDDDQSGDKGEELNLVGSHGLMSGSRKLIPPRAKLVGLMAFSSDYHAPKTHPPKNN